MKTDIENIPNPVIVYDDACIIKYVNHATIEMLGYDNPASITGKKIHDILDENDHPVISEISQLAKSGEKVRSRSKLCHITKNNNCVEALAHFSVLQNGRDQHDKMIIESCFPTGEIFNHLNQQIEKLQHYTTLAENVPGLEMVLVNFEYAIISSMGSELQNQGWAGPEPEGKNVLGYYSKSIAEILKPLLKIAFESTPVSREFKIARKSFSVRLIPLISDKAEITCVILFQDITETKLIEEQLRLSKEEAEDANEARGNFIARMSHEIRTPLNAIIGFSEQLMKTNLNEKQKHFVNVVHNSSSHLLSIIDEILVISRIDSEEIQIDEVPFSIPAVLKAVNNVVEIKYKEKKLDYRTSIDLQLTDQVLLGDAAKLRQVLINLVNNAIKFTHRGSIEIHAGTGRETQKHLTVHFEVRDTGIGISKDNIAMIFDPFQQVDESIGRTYSGTGLGLTISKDIIEKQGGQLTVESTEGKGSVFSFSLQFKKSAENLIAQENEEMIADDIPDGLKILFVDDDPMNRMLGKAILQDMNIHTDYAESGQRALELFRPEKYQMILLDINMPGLDGVEVAKKMRFAEDASGADHKTKIIAMTANVFKKHINKYLEAGMDDVILKPFSEEKILEKIRKHSKQVQIKSPAAKKSFKPVSKTENDDYNLTQLERITKGDKTFLQDMLKTFVENSKSQLERMQKAYQDEDYREIAEAAHRLLPSVDQLEMKKLTTLLKKIEEKYLRKETYNPDEQLIENAIKEMKAGIGMINKVISEW